SKQKIEKELDVPKGHFKRPYTWDDLMDKGTRVMGEDNSRSLMEIAKSFDRRDVKEIFEVVNNVTAKR
ncbi:hypothetical protein ApAK_08700, partial [Thermoplasmatales archaeon AK]|nr:hypothetical protein [Thermoplasmatales archaeon AK]